MKQNLQIKEKADSVKADSGKKQSGQELTRQRMNKGTGAGEVGLLWERLSKKKGSSRADKAGRICKKAPAASP